MSPWILRAAAAAVVVAALGLSARVYFSQPPEGDAPALRLAMLRVEGPRSPGIWESGAAFVLRISLPQEGTLVVVQLDADRQVEFVFPFYDSERKRWDYLGHGDSRLPGGTQVTIPARDFPMTYMIETAGTGEEFLIAFASQQRISEDELLEFRKELREAVDRARHSGSEAQRILTGIRELIAQRFPGPQAVHRYAVD